MCYHNVCGSNILILPTLQRYTYWSHGLDESFVRSQLVDLNTVNLVRLPIRQEKHGEIIDPSLHRSMSPWIHPRVLHQWRLMNTQLHTTTILQHLLWHHKKSKSVYIVSNFKPFQHVSSHTFNWVSQLSHVCWYIHGSATSSFRAVDGKPADGAWIKLMQGMWRLKSKREPDRTCISINILHIIYRYVWIR